MDAEGELEKLISTEAELRGAVQAARNARRRMTIAAIATIAIPATSVLAYWFGLIPLRVALLISGLVFVIAAAKVISLVHSGRLTFYSYKTTRPSIRPDNGSHHRGQ